MTPIPLGLLPSVVEALEPVQSGGEFDPVVSGVAMPATDGPTMIREVRELRTAMPVVFT